MSILIKPYEISVWQDFWQGDKFCEQRLGVIGTNEMLYQGRAIEPSLVRNVNGTKKFSFKMYKHFIDTVTGEKVDNPFIEWLISERKVKLKYEKDEDGNDIWYDFIIKDVVENSSNYLYTYQLEDALVQELSKNGFGITLDEQLRNNMGNVEYLATETLKETDWTIESEVFVERVDEALVYVQLPATLPTGSKVYKLLDDEDDFLESGLQEEEDNSILGKTVLAFYSSCRNKPHRFQFIYLPSYNKANVSIDKNRQILNKNCQYYIEFEPNKYTTTNADYGFVLPQGFSVVSKTYNDGPNVANASDSTISTWYRGGRYGFTQKAEYVPLLNKYCQIYNGPEYTDSTSETGKSNTYYSYVDYKREDLIFSTNLVENTEFSNTSGWTGTYNSSGDSKDKAVIENVYGKFIGSSFVSIANVLAGTANIGQTFEEFLNDSTNKCVPYLKAELKSNKSLVINSGPYHNRTTIGYMPVGSKWAFRADYLADSNNTLVFDIDEYVYNPANGHYSAPASKKIEFEVTEQGGYTIYTVKTNTFTDEKDFTKNCKLKIAISGNKGTYYIKNLEFFRARFDKDNKVIPLESQGTNIESLITTQYRYFKPSELDAATDAKDIHYDYETDVLSYATYKPAYNTNGEKIRAVSAKESNYFNILQSIAETFECWLDLQIIRNDPTQPGAITQKIVKFKNYAGGENYACFRYGVNLKDIQRTHSSKNIVTKLMVKQNSNELGENGMCTIARAGANPTGDTSIYDFSYFQNMGLMNAYDYINTMYKMDGAEGPDIYACLYSSSATKPELPSSYIEDDTWHIKKRVTDKYVCFWKKGTSTPISYECVSTEAYDIDKEYNIQGYFPRLRAINDQLFDKIDEETILKQQLLKLNSDLEVQKAKQSAAASGMEEASESYLQMTGIRPTELVDGKVTIADITLNAGNKYGASDKEKEGYLSYYESDSNPDYTLYASVGADKKIRITASPSGVAKKFQKTKTLSITAYPILTTENNSEFVQTLYFILEIQKDKTSAVSEEQTPVINTEDSQIKKYFNEYAEYSTQKHEADIKVPELESDITELQTTYNALVDTIQTLKDHKIALNNLFFTRYSRFIQEGSWIDEEYYDDEKYYNDALSVMHNSCYPQVAYTINTFEVSQLPGYEMFNFNVGEKTWAEDGEFFGFNADGSPKKEEVIITEKSENLDDPSKNTNKVQNFKNQFQDLFQKITATVQQAQYSTGAYEKGVAEANAIAEDSVGFLREAMSAMTVNLDNPQVMSESTDKSSQLKIVDGKVLIGKRNQNTEEISWTIGLSSDGIAADLINTGRLNTSEIQIYGGDNPTFRWDARGISAYDYTNFNNVISGVNTNKFVRFDKHGIYGINDNGIDGSSWYPTGAGYDGDAFKEIDSKATFALTWEGLKVTGNSGVVVRIGKLGNDILNITKTETPGTGNSQQTTVKSFMSFSNSGLLKIGNWSISENGLENETAGAATVPSIYLNSTGRSLSINKFTGKAETAQIVFKAGENFFVSKNGTLYAANGVFSGTVKATDGLIGGLSLNNERLYSARASANNYIYGMGLNALYSLADYSRTAFFAGAKWYTDSIETGGQQDTKAHFNKILQQKNWAATEAILSGVLPDQTKQTAELAALKTCLQNAGYTATDITAMTASQEAWSTKCDGGANFYVGHTGILQAKKGTFLDCQIDDCKIGGGQIAGFKITKDSFKYYADSTSSSDGDSLYYVRDSYEDDYNKVVNGLSFGGIHLLTRDGIKETNRWIRASLQSSGLALQAGKYEAGTAVADHSLWLSPTQIALRNGKVDALQNNLVLSIGQNDTLGLTITSGLEKITFSNNSNAKKGSFDINYSKMVFSGSEATFNCSDIVLGTLKSRDETTNLSNKQIRYYTVDDINYLVVV